MGIAGWMAGTETEVVGVEDGPDGTLKVYLAHRASGLYVLIEDESAQRKVRDAWGGGGGASRLLIPTPPRECVFRDAVLPETPSAEA